MAAIWAVKVPVSDLTRSSPKLLFRQACEYLSSSRLVRPDVVKILERVATARDWAQDETWARLEPMLTERRCAELDRMLVPDPVLGRTRLTWLGTGSAAATPASVKGELEKLAYLRGMDADTGSPAGAQLPASRSSSGSPPSKRPTPPSRGRASAGAM